GLAQAGALRGGEPFLEKAQGILASGRLGEGAAGVFVPRLLGGHVGEKKKRRGKGNKKAGGRAVGEPPRAADRGTGPAATAADDARSLSGCQFRPRAPGPTGRGRPSEVAPLHRVK